MSTQVSIRFQMPMMPASQAQRILGTEARIPVQVRRIATAATRGKGEAPPLMTALVPLRDGAASLALEPGTYHLRATLPNGERLSETVEITNQQAQQTITLQAAYNAPNETSGWAYVLAEPRRNMSRQADLIMKPSSISLGRGRLSDMAKFSGSDGAKVIADGGGERLIALESSDPGTGDARLWIEKSDGWIPSETSGWDIQPRPFNDPNALVQWQGNVAPAERLWLEVLHPGHASKFALLSPSPADQQTRVLLKLDQIDHLDADPINIILESGNETASVLLAYMHRGDTQAAQAVGAPLLEQAQSLLQGKFSDFTSAVIAAYYMHQYGPTGASTPGWWLAWLRNLDEHFPAHADGAVLRAWQLLHIQDTKAAAERFIAAAGRGLPLFTRGVRLLIDGLELIADLNTGTTGLRDTLVQVRRLASTLDWTEATTTRWGIIRDAAFMPIRCGEVV